VAALTGVVPSNPSQLVQVGPRGPIHPRVITKADDEWSNYTLDDGTILRIRPKVENVFYEPGRYNASGEPIYHFSIGFAIASVVPPHLMQGFAKQKKQSKNKSKSKRVRREKK
jgi:hypothetical protein